MDVVVLACLYVDERAYRWMYSVDGPSMVCMPSMDEILFAIKNSQEDLFHEWRISIHGFAWEMFRFLHHSVYKFNGGRERSPKKGRSSLSSMSGRGFSTWIFLIVLNDPKAGCREVPKAERPERFGTCCDIPQSLDVYQNSQAGLYLITANKKLLMVIRRLRRCSKVIAFERHEEILCYSARDHCLSFADIHEPDYEILRSIVCNIYLSFTVLGGHREIQLDNDRKRWDHEIVPQFWFHNSA